MPTLQERIQKAAKKLEELKKAQRQKEAKERAAQSKKQRTMHTRRLIIAGAHYLSNVSDERYQAFVNGLQERDKAAYEGYSPFKDKTSENA